MYLTQIIIFIMFFGYIFGFFILIYFYLINIINIFINFKILFFLISIFIKY